MLMSKPTFFVCTQDSINDNRIYSLFKVEGYYDE